MESPSSKASLSQVKKQTPAKENKFPELLGDCKQFPGSISKRFRTKFKMSGKSGALDSFL